MAAGQTLAPPAAGRNRAPGRLFDPGGGLSLDDVVSLAWERLEAPGESSPCVVCGEPIAWNGDDQRAECDACGSRLE